MILKYLLQIIKALSLKCLEKLPKDFADMQLLE